MWTIECLSCHGAFVEYHGPSLPAQGTLMYPDLNKGWIRHKDGTPVKLGEPMRCDSCRVSVDDMTPEDRFRQANLDPGLFREWNGVNLDSVTREVSSQSSTRCGNPYCGLDPCPQAKGLTAEQKLEAYRRYSPSIE